jgi:hypothetical protein
VFTDADPAPIAVGRRAVWPRSFEIALLIEPELQSLLLQLEYTASARCTFPPEVCPWF